MRSTLGLAAGIVFAWYAFTPLLFCVLMPSSNICAAPDWEGVVDSIYFASTTVSISMYCYAIYYKYTPPHNNNFSQPSRSLRLDMAT
jgi:hypothetical protein